MAVSKRLRYEILNRDQNTCRYCGRTAPDVPLTVDHVIPVALGGTDDPTNLAAACRECNAGKSSSSPDAPLVAQVTDDALRWADAMRQAAADWHRGAVEVRDAFAEAWNAHDGGGVPDSWGQSIDNMAAAGLDADAMRLVTARAFERAHVDDRWGWFCGCAWNAIRKLQEAAAEIVTASHPDPVPAEEPDHAPYIFGSHAATLGLSPRVTRDLGVAAFGESSADDVGDGWKDFSDWEPGGSDDVQPTTLAGYPETYQSGFAGFTVEAV